MIRDTQCDTYTASTLLMYEHHDNKLTYDLCMVWMKDTITRTFYKILAFLVKLLDAHYVSAYCIMCLELYTFVFD